MQGMRERSKKILLAAVEDFLKSGKPITSKRLFDKYHFGIKPAMIRWELNFLGENGYLYQPHHSSGRYPTNKAYRFFVENFKEKLLNLENFETKKFEKIVLELLRGDFDVFTKDMSSMLKVLSICYIVKENYFYSNGFYNLFENFKFYINREEILFKELLDVVRDFDMLRESMVHDFLKESFNEPIILIGKNKYLKSDWLSVVIDCVDLENDKIIVASAGPKRMDYKNVLGFFSVLDNFFKK